MITEPELVGGTAFPAAEVPLAEPAPQAPRPPRPRRPWLWALGGAVVASAVWAGGLHAYDRTQDGGPDLGGYRTVGNLCDKVELKALQVELGKKSPGDDLPTPTRAHPALDRARCSVVLGSPESGFTADVTYDLHKVTDPGPEFEPRLAEMMANTEPVEGLGERAYVHRDEDNSGAWISVLDGQAQLDIWINSQLNWDVETDQAVPADNKVDLSGIEAVLIQDMKALMAALKE
ncbi:hypothetical protein [Streptomyces sp. NPDC006551]|uniref:hypothetical protein n=1 Tax=Streptomyces sp. NPDC006551 TaxID=3157178 RepID=UPI0033AA3B2A